MPPLQPCPDWCAVDHVHDGSEDDSVHISGGVAIVDGVDARLVRDDEAPAAEDYVLVGDEERSIDETARLGASLIGLVEAAGRARAGLGTRSPGPSPAAS